MTYRNREILAGVCMALTFASAVSFFAWLYMPYTTSGTLTRKSFVYTTFIDKLGSARTTENYYTANSGVILRQWDTCRPQTTFDAEGKPTTTLEWYTVYEYRPWELQHRLSNQGEESPRHADSSSYPSGDEWRRRYEEKHYWHLGETTIAVKELGDWNGFNVGDVIEVKHRFGWMVSAKLAESEVTSADFDF